MENEPVHPAEEIGKKEAAKAAHALYMPTIKKMLGMPGNADDPSSDKQEGSPKQNS